VNITIIAKAATTINVHSGRRPALPFAVMRSFGDGASDLPATQELTATITSDPPAQLEWSGTLGDSRMTHADAEKACAELRLGGYDDWRLPTLQELQSIVDYNRCNPAIDTTLFPDTKAEVYWTASPVASRPGCAWFVYFNYGYVCSTHRGDVAWVRAVRGPRASE